MIFFFPVKLKILYEKKLTKLLLVQILSEDNLIKRSTLRGMYCTRKCGHIYSNT